LRKRKVTQSRHLVRRGAAECTGALSREPAGLCVFDAARGGKDVCSPEPAVTAICRPRSCSPRVYWYVCLMRIAVVTPYFKEDISILECCHRSVNAQTIPCSHVMVADGFPSAEVARWAVEHVVLPAPHDDKGSTPRVAGSFHAIGLGFDGIAFLDADNWYRPDHIASLLELHRRSGASFLTSSRFLCRLDGSIMGRCHMTDGVSFVDTSCMLLMRPAFRVISNWCLMPGYAQIISDRVFLFQARAARIEMAHSDEPTVYYRCGKPGIYQHFDEAPPAGVQPRPDYEAAFRRWTAEGNPPLAHP
jgi:hypothetical protein